MNNENNYQKYYSTKNYNRNWCLKCWNHLSSALSLELRFYLVQGHQAFPAHLPDSEPLWSGMRCWAWARDLALCGNLAQTRVQRLGPPLWRNRPKPEDFRSLSLELLPAYTWICLTRPCTFLTAAVVSSCCPLTWIPASPEDYLMEQGVEDLSKPTAGTHFLTLSSPWWDCECPGCRRRTPPLWITVAQ